MEVSNKYILSTRPLDDSIISNAAEKNIVVECLSFIQTEPVTNDTLSKRIVEVVSTASTVVFTSMNAVEAVAGHLQAKRTEWNIFCLGTATKKLVQQYFGDDLIGGTAPNALSLAEEIIRKNISRVVFFCGDQRRDELPEKLAAHNIGVEEIVVYNTLPVAQQVNKDYDGIMFFSPSAVESFFSANSISDTTILFAIGATTAECIRRFSRNLVIESDLPGKETLVEKAVDYYYKSNQFNERTKE